MWSILENVPCALEKKVYSSAFGWNVLKISMRFISSNVSFKTPVSLLIFCFDDQSIGVSEVLKSPNIAVLLTVSPFMSVFVLCTGVILCWAHQSVLSFSLHQLFATPWSAPCQTSLSITNTWSLLKLMYIELVMPSSHLILGHHLLLLTSIFPSIRAFSKESVLHVRYQSIGSSVSASVLPMNIQD